jgi:membrane-bound metal-dependent hydrolase YbcI (DUF457 family)
MCLTTQSVILRGALREQLPEDQDWGERFQFRSSLIAIMFGGWSHVFLDSLMHADQRPLAPFSNVNALLGLVPVEALHLACLWSFAAAGLVWGIRRIFRKRI